MRRQASLGESVSGDLSRERISASAAHLPDDIHLRGHTIARVDAALRRIRNITWFYPWSSLHTKEEAEKMGPKIDALISKLAEALQPWKREGDTGWDVLEKRWESAGGLSTVRYGDAAWRKAFEAAGPISDYIGVCAARYAQWETIRDIKGFEINPYKYIMGLYEMGVWFPGLGGPEGEIIRPERFTTHFFVHDGTEIYMVCHIPGNVNMFRHGQREPCTRVELVP